MSVNLSTADESMLSDYRGRLTTEGRSLHEQAQQEHDQTHLREPQSTANVGDAERKVSVASGAIIALLGLARRDLAGLVLAGVGGALVYRGASGNCPMYSALGINSAQDSDGQPLRQDHSRGVRVTQTFTINKPAQELYEFWRDLEKLPRIMTHLKEVRVLDERKSHWVAMAPAIAGGQIEWDAEITEDTPGQRIAWRSVEGSSVETAGSVKFEESPRGTIVRADMTYIVPGGVIGNLIAKLFGENPETIIREDLRNFKRMMEIGDVLTTQGQPSGTCTGQGKYQAENNTFLKQPSA